MSSDRVIIDAIKMAQRLLWQNLAPTHNLPDATTVMRFRDLVRSPAIQSALEGSSDTFAAFALRAVERALADRSRTDREIISRLWDVLDDPHLYEALGLPQNSRIAFRRRCPPTRHTTGQERLCITSSPAPGLTRSTERQRQRDRVS